jgi:hypothetical protein
LIGAADQGGKTVGAGHRADGFGRFVEGQADGRDVERAGTRAAEDLDDLTGASEAVLAMPTTAPRPSRA